MKYTIVLLMFLNLWCGAKAACVMRGDCVVVDGFPKPCPADNIEAPLLISGLSPNQARLAVDALKLRCPTFARDADGNELADSQIRTCCDGEQLLSMADSLMIAEGILGRCPACMRNFARQVCEMNCSPDQSRYVDVHTETTSDGTEYVNEIDYRVYNDFMIEAHASCSEVIVPQTGMPAINMMCGNAVVCDADAWFGFTGDTEGNPLTPVQVNFLRWPTEEDSMNVRALSCNETFDEDLPCSCVDCFDRCPLGTEPVAPSFCTVGSVHCIGFSVGISFFVLSVTTFIILCFLEIRYNRKKDSKPPADDPEWTGNAIIRMFQRVLSKIGGVSASNPVLMIMLTTWIAFSMSYGVFNLNITANPLELWSAPDSRSRAELNYFNSRFGPFYRAAQVFLTFDLDPIVGGPENATYGPAFRFEAVQELIALEDRIMNIGRENGGGVTLEQVCYAPLRQRGGEPRLDECVSQSVSTYVNNERDNLNENTYLNTIQGCLNNYFALNCMADWGGGAQPELAFGGFDDDNVLGANTLLINYPISNYLLEEDLEPVLEWEQSFIDLLHDYIENDKPDYVTVAFGTERSIEDEIRRVSVAESVPIAISYILMLVYVTIALGHVRSWRTWLVDSKIMVAFSSIIVVLIAIYCAMGIMGYAGITLSLLAINVIPFFVLSVGVDNVFLMVNTLHEIKHSLKSFSDYNENMNFEEERRFIFEKMLGRVGPSMMVASATQITCFAIGSLANFPAVVTFSVLSSISLAFLLIFQVTTVVAFLSIDYKRASQNRLDLLCCVQRKILDDENPLTSGTPRPGITKRFMKPYSKFLLRWKVKIIVAILFMTLLCSSVILIPQIEIGLDQQLALPKDSYVYSYLEAVNDLMRIGPPVYFVLKAGLNFSDPIHQNVICGGQLCHDDSLFTQVFMAARHSDITYVSLSSNSWLDDFMEWTSLPGSCCKYNTTDGTFCQSTDDSPECAYCTISRNSEYANGVLRPSDEAFQRYIPFFLRDTPTDICNKAGLASYSTAVNYVLDSDGLATVYDTNFMAFHSRLGTSLDYINAVRYGYEISGNISNAILEHTGMDIEVFPYSVFTVFYEQYLFMWRDTFVSICYSLIGAMLLNLITSGFNVLTTFAVLCTVVMVVIDMMGVMYLWNIPLNAVSCVNLIVSIGITVEFCSHIAYAFAISKRPPGYKAEDAIRSVGSTIITGITFTNIPVIVLAFSYTEVIEIFFFRMFFSMVLLGFVHGMIFFPVLLNYLEYFTIKK